MLDWAGQYIFKNKLCLFKWIKMFEIVRYTYTSTYIYHNS